MSGKVVRTETIAAKGWCGEDIIDVAHDLSIAFDAGERVVVIAEAEYERLKAYDAMFTDYDVLTRGYYDEDKRVLIVWPRETAVTIRVNFDM